MKKSSDFLLKRNAFLNGPKFLSRSVKTCFSTPECLTCSVVLLFWESRSSISSLGFLTGFKITSLGLGRPLQSFESEAPPFAHASSWLIRGVFEATTVTSLLNNEVCSSAWSNTQCLWAVGGFQSQVKVEVVMLGSCGWGLCPFVLSRITELGQHYKKKIEKPTQKYYICCLCLTFWMNALKKASDQLKYAGVLWDPESMWIYYNRKPVTVSKSQP